MLSLFSLIQQKRGKVTSIFSRKYETNLRFITANHPRSNHHHGSRRIYQDNRRHYHNDRSLPAVYSQLSFHGRGSKVLIGCCHTNISGICPYKMISHNYSKSHLKSIALKNVLLSTPRLIITLLLHDVDLDKIAIVFKFDAMC